MSHTQHQHEKFLVFDLVHDAVVAGANSALAGAADELDRRNYSEA